MGNCLGSHVSLKDTQSADPSRTLEKLESLNPQVEGEVRCLTVAK